MRQRLYRSVAVCLLLLMGLGCGDVRPAERPLTDDTRLVRGLGLRVVGHPERPWDTAFDVVYLRQGLRESALDDRTKRRVDGFVGAAEHELIVNAVESVRHSEDVAACADRAGRIRSSLDSDVQRVLRRDQVRAVNEQTIVVWAEDFAGFVFDESDGPEAPEIAGLQLTHEQKRRLNELSHERWANGLAPASPQTQASQPDSGTVERWVESNWRNRTASRAILSADQLRRIDALMLEKVREAARAPNASPASGPAR